MSWFHIIEYADPYLPCSAAIKFHSITNSALLMRCRVSAKSRQIVSTMLSIATTLQQPTHSLCTSKCTTHLPLPTHHYPPHCHNPSLHTTNKHKAYLCKWWQNGTRCRDGVKVLWCHSHLVWLVFEAFIPTCAFLRLCTQFPDCAKMLMLHTLASTTVL